MDLQMFGQMVGPGELLLAEFAGIRFYPGVRSLVTRQFVGSREPPAAPRPVARERLLTCMSPQVRLQVRALAVHLVAPGVRTAVYAVVLLVHTRRQVRRRRMWYYAVTDPAGRRQYRSAVARSSVDGGGGGVVPGGVVESVVGTRQQ